jgi:hypothetical protein
MAKKTVDWMKSNLDAMVQQFDQFTLKLPSYQAAFGLTAAQVTAARNDYLWTAFAVQCVVQYDAELKNRVSWRDHLLDGPITPGPAPIPSVGTEFSPPGVPAVPDGALPRWRKLVELLKASPAYTKAIGEDLGIEAPEAPAQAMKPTVKCATEPNGKVFLNVLKDGHDALAVFCKRGAEPQPSLLGVYTRARIEDARPTLVPGQPELREYTIQYRDADQPVGEMSDVCRVTVQP